MWTSVLHDPRQVLHRSIRCSECLRSCCQLPHREGLTVAIERRRLARIRSSIWQLFKLCRDRPASPALQSSASARHSFLRALQHLQSQVECKRDCFAMTTLLKSAAEREALVRSRSTVLPGCQQATLVLLRIGRYSAAVHFDAVMGLASSVAAPHTTSGRVGAMARRGMLPRLHLYSPAIALCKLKHACEICCACSCATMRLCQRALARLTC